jgi:hypothetical protein
MDQDSNSSDRTAFNRRELMREFNEHISKDLEEFDTDEFYDKLMVDGTFDQGTLCQILDYCYYKCLLRSDIDLAIQFDNYRKCIDSTPNTKVKIAYILVQIQKLQKFRSFTGYYL